MTLRAAPDGERPRAMAPTAGGRSFRARGGWLLG